MHAYQEMIELFGLSCSVTMLSQSVMSVDETTPPGKEQNADTDEDGLEVNMRV